MTVALDQQLAAYDGDFCAWLEQQAALMRAGRFDLLDVENVAEELDALGWSDKRAFDRHFRTPFVHLLKWQMQPWRRSDVWLNSIHKAREAIARVMADSPSLRTRLPLAVQSEFPGAVRQAAREKRAPEKYFPAICPWSMDRLLNEDVLPENRQ